MPDPKNRQLSSELNDVVLKDSRFQAYIRSVDELERQISDLYKPDAQGLPPLLDGDRLAKLKQSYMRTAELAEGFISNPPKLFGKEKHRNASSVVKKISRILSTDLTALQQYEQRLAEEGAKAESLPTVIENARVHTIDLSSAKIDAKHGAMSQRLPMELSMDGKTVKGVFTKRSTLSYLNDYDKAMKRAKGAASHDANAKKALDNLLPAFRAYLRAQPGVQSPYQLTGDDEKDILVLAEYMSDECDKGEDIAEVKLCNILAGYGRPQPGDPEIFMFGGPVTGTLATELSSIHRRKITHDLNNIKQGSRLDDRNSAMSKTASLLGVSKVLCGAVPMRYRDERGKIVEGTFMEMSKGVDCFNPGSFKREADMGSLDHNQGFLCDLADLEALDFICGNTDRHMGNMMLTFDDGDPAKITGVQGIDNDLSFGVHCADKRLRNMTEPKEMLVMRQSTAEKIKALTPAQLKFALREYNLSEDELNAAAKRLKFMQKKIDDGVKYYNGKPAPEKNKPGLVAGHLRVLPDEDFAKLRLADLGMLEKSQQAAQKKKTSERPNIFGRAIQNVKMLCKRVKAIASRAAGSGQPKPEKKEEELTKVSFVNRATRESASQQLETMNGLSSKGSELKEPSEETKKLVDAVNEYRDFQKKLNERLNRKPGDPGYSDFDNVIGANDMFKMKSMLRKLDEQAGKCCDSEELGAEEKKFAQEVYGSTSGLAHMPPEIDAEEEATVSANERQAMENFNRRMANEFSKKAPQDDGPVLAQ